MSPGWRLTGFYLRRAAPPVTLFLFGALLFLACSHDWSPDLVLPTLTTGESNAALARRGVWSVLTPIVGFMSLLAAATIGSQWRSGDALWIGARRPGRSLIATAALAGVTLAGSAGLLAIAGAAEIASGGSSGHERARGSATHRALVLAGPDEKGSLALFVPPDLPFDSSLRVRPLLLPGGRPTAEVAVGMVWGQEPEGAQPREWTAIRLVGDAFDLSLPARGPRSGQAATLWVRRNASGAGMVIPSNSILWVARSTHPLGGLLALIARFAVPLAFWCAIAAAAGAWTRPGIAFTAPLAVLSWAWSSGWGSGWLPGASLPAIIADLGTGLDPGSIPGSMLVIFALTVPVTIALLARGLDRGCRQ